MHNFLRSFSKFHQQAGELESTASDWFFDRVRCSGLLAQNAREATATATADRDAITVLAPSTLISNASTL